MTKVINTDVDKYIGIFIGKQFYKIMNEKWNKAQEEIHWYSYICRNIYFGSSDEA